MRARERDVGALLWSTERMMRPGVRLGVDVGSARVGLAASDAEGVLASPVETLSRDTTPARSDQEAVLRLARERSAVEVVVGLPRSLTGEEGEAARLARAYATELSVLLQPTPVRLVDERLTTVQSHRQLRESGVAGRAQRSVVDQVAAVLILQSALDTERAGGPLPGELVGGRRRRARTRGLSR